MKAKSKTAFRWHPLFIRWCLNIMLTSSPHANFDDKRHIHQDAVSICSVSNKRYLTDTIIITYYF